MHYLNKFLFFLCAAILAGLFPQVATAKDSPQSKLRVMMIGNSLIYTSNLPGVLGALAESQEKGPSLEVHSYVAPGGTLTERWNDGVAAQALRDGEWDFLILQERGAVLSCMAIAEARHELECKQSLRAHRNFVRLAKSQGIKVLLFGTWNADQTNQKGIDQGTREMAWITRSEFIPFGNLIHDSQRRHPQTRLLADGIHLGFEGALLVAARLYHELTGLIPSPKPLTVDFALLRPESTIDPLKPLEIQHPLTQENPQIQLAIDIVQPWLQEAAEFNDKY